ncbi:hypothetical protein DL762_001423 [Monosporascus cannonballus]|uniref:NACHT domain-containing protein n=1 Tax=Monosporascus cannonballus TaxID=155416 RepID=A0ABY0HKV4_9PEZI|nr:hypothetical protein DL762_001423 [Monosporascus cannonballus]
MAELDPELYTVAWLAPLEIEAQAALHMLDKRHQGRFPMGRGDDYVFQAGEMCGHYVIVATLPAGQEYGTGSAAALASQVKKFFPNLWFGLLVGVAAGLPNLTQSPPLDIRLGDVLVGLPTGESAGLIAYDLGKETAKDGFQPLRFGHVLASTETVVRSAIGSIKLKAPKDAEAFLPYYETIKHKEHSSGTFVDPGQERDKLYLVDDSGTERLVERQRRPDDMRARVWYGPIGSGEKLIKNAQKRNKLRDKHGVIGLEMEAVGTMNRIPVGVIRGVCDYGDEHKNKEWQPYAAAMAAAYTKGLLSEIPPKITRKKPVLIQSDEDKRCLAHLWITDPRNNKERIKQTKGGLLEDSSGWILEHEDFRRWRNNDEARLLWIKGDPGKGKTMLLIAIVDELERQLGQLKQLHQQSTTVLSYFFCQGTNSDLNNATAVLRGLIYLLGVRNPSLLSHLRKRYDTAGLKLFESANAFIALSEVLEGMLRDASLSWAYIVIDALDECGLDLQRLLKFIVHNSSASPRVKWIVSSRNRPDIEQQLKLDNSGMKLSLELTQNAEQVAHAVDAYINFKASKLWPLQNRNTLEENILATRRDQVREVMRRKSNGTFLWAAFVFVELQDILVGEVLEVLEEIPSGLTELYDRMIEQIRHLKPKHREYCYRVLSTATLAYRPLHLLKLQVLAGFQDGITYLADLMRIVKMCGSFLTIRNNYVYFIHPSVKDYLSDKASNTIFPSGPTDGHHAIFSRSLQAMSTLQRDIYNLHHPGLLIGEIKAPDPDPLAAIRYSCVHWIGHFCDVYSSSRSGDQVGPHEADMVGQFFREKFLYWLEALGLIQHVGDAILSMTRLERLLRNREVIENAPLKTYASALVFNPVRNQGRWKGAEDLEVQVLETRKTKPGTDDPAILTSKPHKEPKSGHDDVASHINIGKGYGSEYGDDLATGADTKANNFGMSVTESPIEEDPKADYGDVHDESSIGSPPQSSVSSVFDRDNRSRGTCLLTTVTSEARTKAESLLPASSIPEVSRLDTTLHLGLGTDHNGAVAGNNFHADAETEEHIATDHSDAETTCSIDSTSDDLKLRYIQVFTDQLARDISPSSIDMTSKYFDHLLKAFAWKLHGESSGPFQWGAAVDLYWKRNEMITLLTSNTPEIDHVGGDENEDHEESISEEDEEEEDEKSRQSFDPAMVAEWADRIEPPNVGDEESGQPVSVAPVQEDLCGDVDTAAATAPEPILGQLPEYEKIIRESDAYQWLLSKIGQHGRLVFRDSNLMFDIGATVRKQLLAHEPLRKISRRQPLSRVRMTFNLDWDPVHFIHHHNCAYPLSGVLEKVVCLTGSWDGAQAATVMEYMRQTWPVTGEPIVHLLQELITLPKGQECYYQLPEPKLYQLNKPGLGPRLPRPKTAQLAACIQPPSSCSISITGDRYFVSEIAEQIGWLASALRSSPISQGLVACDPRVEDFNVRVQNEGTPAAMVVGTCCMRFVFSSRGVGSGLPVFCRPILVRGYPIPRTPAPKPALDILGVADGDVCLASPPCLVGNAMTADNNDNDKRVTPHWLEEDVSQETEEALFSEQRSFEASHGYDYDISFTRDFASAAQDCFKRGIKHIVGARLSWWPLAEPEDELGHGRVRVYSAASRCRRIYDDVPTRLAEALFPKLITVRKSAPKSNWILSNREAVLLHDTTLIRILLSQKTHFETKADEQEHSGVQTAAQHGSGNNGNP